MKKVLVTTLALCLVFVLGTAFLASPAYAYSYDGSNPHTTGCDNPSTTWTVFQISNTAGDSLELRFSDSCQTAWARFTCNQFSCSSFSFYVRRDQDGANERIDMDFPDLMFQGSSLYTMQLYDGAGFSSKACLYEQLPQQTYCTDSF